MNNKIKEDLSEMKKKLGLYVDKGRVPSFLNMKQEPLIAVKPDVAKIQPLKRMINYEGQFLAVDCSTRTLKRANNWGVYLMRPSYVIVRGRDVEWGYDERLFTVVGDMHVRRGLLEDCRLELESLMSLNMIEAKFKTFYDGQGSVRRDYVFLDGGSYFGGERKFRVSLYDECKKRGICLLAISKNSSILHDEKGRDLIATTGMISPYKVWVYPSIKKTNMDEHLYGDVCIVKLSEDSDRIFRCDVMEYLTNYDMSNLLSPLTFLSEDPRCLGYPVPLFLAHQFSTPAEAMLLHYHDQIKDVLQEAGLLDSLSREELACNFPDMLHGVKYAFDLEWIERV